MKNFIILEYIFLIIFIPFYCIGVSGNEDAVDSSFVIQVDDSLLTANVKNIPLNKALKEVAKKTSTKIVSLVSTEEFLMADFSRLPIGKGLRLLLRDFNYAIIYGSEKSKYGESEIRKIIVLSSKERSQNSKIESKNTLSLEESSLEVLSKALNDKDPEVREELVFIIGQLHEPRSIEILSGVLLNDSDGDVRTAAADALGNIKSVVAIGSLENALLEDDNDDVRITAAEALGNINSESAMDSLLETLKDSDTDTEVRESVLGVSGRIGGHSAIQALETLILSENDEDIKETAIEILEQINL